jgi:glycosyltransferase involved in cell wall biosynthesis
MRLLICTLYFPPCVITPANRTFSWARYLPQFGIYPIIITRQWNNAISDEFYMDTPVGNEVYIEKKPGYEVHFLPFRGNYRTRSLTQPKNIFKKITVKIFTAFEFIFRYWITGLLPYANMFKYTQEYVKNNKVDKILISGKPFLLFKIGYLINKKLKIPWVADYRDGWTTDNYKEAVGPLTNPIHLLNRHFEKKWMATAATFVTVSDHIKNGIQNFTGLNGHTVYNGFYPENNEAAALVKNNVTITFLYSGVVYGKQDYKTAVTIFKKIIDKYKGQIEVKLLFLGSAFANPAFANDPMFKNYEAHIVLMDRVDYQTALRIHGSADVFLMLSHKGKKGIVSSKIFDYLKFYKPVVLFDNDFDVLEEVLINSRLGIIAGDAQVLEQKLENIVKEKLETGIIYVKPDVEYINSFSRENQAKKLAELITGTGFKK